MAPLLQAALAILPVVLKDKQEFKKNLTTTSTALAAVTAAATTQVPEVVQGDQEQLITQAVMSVLALVLFCLRKRGG